MTNMLEQVARAICRAELDACGEVGLPVGVNLTPEEWVERRWKRSLPAALATLTVLRNPTEEMVNEGIETVCECGHTNHGARDTFIAMIDEALRADKTQT